MLREGKDKERILDIIYRLSQGEKIEHGYRDHQLTGKLAAYRECHLDPDWLLMYRIKDNELILACTGSHSDLFK